MKAREWLIETYGLNDDFHGAIRHKSGNYGYFDWTALMEEYAEYKVKEAKSGKPEIPDNHIEYEYPGYMSHEAQQFFHGNTIIEPRDGCAASGTFIKLSDGSVYLPKKGDVFIKQSIISIKP